MARTKARTVQSSWSPGGHASWAAGGQWFVRNANYRWLLLKSNLHGRLSKSKDSSEAESESESDCDSIWILPIAPEGIHMYGKEGAGLVTGLGALGTCGQSLVGKFLRKGPSLLLAKKVGANISNSGRFCGK